ncbi:MAG: glycosyltransferase [candidate division Zixibacteria bacterium]|nr:glycosyltransferase [candidate division Zixibacteria bacterium]
MKRVLMISYVFPPMAAVGGYRTIKYCKFLPEFGWQPSVLTVREGYNFSYDQALLDQVDRAVNIHRSGNLEPLVWWDMRSASGALAGGTSSENPPSGGGHEPSPSMAGRIKRYLRRALSIPDQNNFWIPFGVWTGLQAIRRDRIDVLYSTSPPASTHVVGCLLSYLTGRPLVVDFRDLWTQNESYQLKNIPPMLQRLDRFMEQRVLRRSRAVVTATESFSTLVRQKNPSLPSSQIHTITNGIDADDFAHLDLPTRRNDRFTILHLGSLYGHRDPAFFFDALRIWAQRRPEAVTSTSAVFIGNTPGYERLVTESPLKDMVQFSSHIPHDQVLLKLWESDLLLLILGFDASVGGVLPAKLFEYVCTGRPILALIPPGESERVLESYESGHAVTEPDLERTVQVLDDRFTEWQNSGPTRESKAQPPPQFDRRQLAGKLADILNTL